jgi:TP53 regulating kinase-like protein
LDKVTGPVLIKKGAEASIYLTDWHGRRVIMKKRFPKRYRPLKMDEQIRTYRTVHEPQLMHEAKKAGVPTPVIFLIDKRNATVVMEFIAGKQVKQLLNEVETAEKRRLCLRIGELIGMLHTHGIIHGDLTTSNMILNSEGKIFFVDFGLGEKSKELESKGVDLHLLKRALQSTHFRFTEECFDAVIRGYSEIVDADAVKNVLNKIGEIERRGRYVAERKGETE